MSDEVSRRINWFVRQVAVLGTTTAKVKALYRAGKLPEPARRVSSGTRIWTDAEFAATAAAYAQTVTG